MVGNKGPWMDAGWRTRKGRGGAVGGDGGWASAGTPVIRRGTHRGAEDYNKAAPAKNRRHRSEPVLLVAALALHASQVPRMYYICLRFNSLS